MRIIHREDQEQREHVELSRDAAFADESDGRDRSAEPDILRTDYQRDRDKILHTKSFRRLSHKTQVFLPPRATTSAPVSRTRWRWRRSPAPSPARWG